MPGAGRPRRLRVKVRAWGQGPLPPLTRDRAGDLGAARKALSRRSLLPTLHER